MEEWGQVAMISQKARLFGRDDKVRKGIAENTLE